MLIGILIGFVLGVALTLGVIHLKKAPQIVPIDPRQKFRAIVKGRVYTASSQESLDRLIEGK